MDLNTKLSALGKPSSHSHNNKDFQDHNPTIPISADAPPYVLDFGSHRGKTLTQCPPSYVSWLMKKDVGSSRPNLKASLVIFNETRKSHPSPFTAAKRAAPGPLSGSNSKDRQALRSVISNTPVDSPIQRDASSTDPASARAENLKIKAVNLIPNKLPDTMQTTVVNKRSNSRHAHTPQDKTAHPLANSSPSVVKTEGQNAEHVGIKLAISSDLVPNPLHVKHSASSSKRAIFVMPFGKYRGKMLSEIPLGYVEWLKEQSKRKLMTSPAVEAAVASFLAENVTDTKPSDILSTLPSLINKDRFYDRSTGKAIWITFYDAKKYFGMGKEHVEAISKARGPEGTNKKRRYWLARIWQLMVLHASQDAADKAVTAFLEKNEEAEDDIMASMGMSMRNGYSMADTCGDHCCEGRPDEAGDAYSVMVNGLPWPPLP